MRQAWDCQSKLRLKQCETHEFGLVDHGGDNILRAAYTFVECSAVELGLLGLL